MTDSKALIETLERVLNRPGFDLVGPTADDDVRRAIERYGAAAVKEAVQRQTTPKRGRKLEPNDLPELREIFVADAKDWLAGGDPFKTRKDYSIAKTLADRGPSHSHPSTLRRISRKLGKKRVWQTLVEAMYLGEKDYPYAAYIRTLKAMRDQEQEWAFLLDRAQSSVEDYKAKFGNAPPAKMSMEEISVAVRTAFKGAMVESPSSAGEVVSQLSFVVPD